MMTKTARGVLLGALAGFIDLIPMVFQRLTLDADLSAFSMWVVVGFLITHTDLRMKGAVKGVFISLLVLLPSAILIGWGEPISLIPISIMTIILGSVLGYLIDRE